MIFDSPQSFSQSYTDRCIEKYGCTPKNCGTRERYAVLAELLAGELRRRLAQSDSRDMRTPQVYYFSMEFLIGNMLTNTLFATGLEDTVRLGLTQLGIDLDTLLPCEDDAALGNGGLGRLAACFLDSMAFLGIHGHGNGILYRSGLLKQEIWNNVQHEVPETWLEEGDYPWAARRSDRSFIIKFGGDVHMDYIDGRMYFRQTHWEGVRAVPYELPMLARDGKSVNVLRLWKAESPKGFDLSSFNRGDFLGGLSAISRAESISQVLYPNDNSFEGRRLRLMQEYFCVSAGLAAIVADYKVAHKGSLKGIDDLVRIHVNDTHPTLCIPELMRIFMDEEKMEWNSAWAMTVKMVSYTNHTVMPEALECWPVSLMKAVLPRVHMIISEINRRWMDFLYRDKSLDMATISRMAIIRDDTVHMADLSVVGSHSVNGVAGLHSEILKNDVLKDFYRVFPQRFNNKTNGISQRLFLMKANPGLASLLDGTVGPGWRQDPNELEKLMPYAGDAGLQEEFFRIKRERKQHLADYVRKTQNITLNPDALFDVQVKRIHAYKRQLLNIMQIMDAYNRILDGETMEPRVYFMAGKAAPGYALAKSIICLANTLSRHIEATPGVRDVIKLVFLPNLNVTLGEMIYPAADISQQISTAGKEASGTGNMKFMMNGAVTLCTLDGANVELLQLVGEENAIRFGLTTKEISELRRNKNYNPSDYYVDHPRIRRIIDQINGNLLPGDTNQFQDISASLLQWGDEFFVLADFDAYVAAQEKALLLYKDQPRMRRMQLVNIAKSGFFSSDRSIREYARDIWGLEGF